MATVKIRLRRSKLTGKAGSLYFQVIHCSKSVQITTSYRVLPSEWDEDSQSVLSVDSSVNKEHLQSVHRGLRNELAMLKSVIRSLDDSGTPYVVADVARDFRKAASGCSFLTFMDEQIQLLYANKQLGTARNYERTRVSFSHFLCGKDVLFPAFTEELMLEYEAWLKQKQLVRNTTSFYMRVLSAVYNKAVDKGVTIQTLPFKKVYTGIDRTRKRAIDEEVLNRLRALKLELHSSLFYARDLFLFSFYSRGMSFVDMAYLKKTDIRNGVIQYVRQKTQQWMNVRVETCMQEILDRYAPQTIGRDYCFPIITSGDGHKAYDQYRNGLSYYNKQLKRLSAMLGISIPLSSHVSRHTWATTAQKKNVPIAVISVGMGHSSQSTTEIYLDSFKNSVVDEANLTVISYINV